MGGTPRRSARPSWGCSAVLVEEDKVGGTCLHRGCIPAKALLQSAALLDQLRPCGDLFGVTTGEVTSTTPVAGTAATRW